MSPARSFDMWIVFNILSKVLTGRPGIWAQRMYDKFLVDRRGED